MRDAYRAVTYMPNLFAALRDAIITVETFQKIIRLCAPLTETTVRMFDDDLDEYTLTMSADDLHRDLGKLIAYYKALEGSEQGARAPATWSVDVRPRFDEPTTTDIWISAPASSLEPYSATEP